MTKREEEILITFAENFKLPAWLSFILTLTV